MELRERYLEKNGPYGSMQQMTTILNLTKSITGDEPKNRLLWTENIPDITPEEREKLVKDQAEVVYFTGCVSALFPQAYKIPQSLTRILLKTNIDFSLLGEDEWCCGYPKLAAGCGEDSINDFAVHNLEAIKAKGAKTLLVSCPTCYHVWKNEYSQSLGKQLDIEIKHYTEYLPELIKQGNINFKTDEVTITYHDPCDLGRKSDVIEEPRELISMLPGVKLVEMRFIGKDSKCCGGGGNLEMTNSELSLEIAQKRVAEALETNAQYLVTTCQQCKRTLQNAVRKMRARIKVYDLLEFIAERIDTSNGGETK
jgi:heterodisulfide reductase subunit D